MGHRGGEGWRDRGGRDKYPFGHVSTATRPPRHKFRGFNRDPWLPVSGDHKLLAAMPRHHWIICFSFIRFFSFAREIFKVESMCLRFLQGSSYWIKGDRDY